MSAPMSSYTTSTKFRLRKFVSYMGIIHHQSNIFGISINLVSSNIDGNEPM
uniref:Uncharacterized protein n=1 Tax=Arundo donax TaxID=35708 RepID=A0A0A8ZRX4_ARUDO